MAAKKRLKVGIIGAGGIAHAHMRNYAMMAADAEIVAVADLIPGRAESFCEAFDLEETARCYPSHKELLDNEELDAVSICTYNTTHAECAIYALNKGVNVLLEKPMCVTLEEAIAMVRAEKASGKILTIGFQPRFDANMMMVKQVVQSGVLGEIYYVQTGGGRQRGVPNSTFIETKTAGIGAMGDIGCYSLDMVLNAIGYPKPLTVTGYTSGFFGGNPLYNNPADAARFDVEDFAAAFVRLEGGIILDFRISWAMHIDTTGDTIILGKDGALRIPSTPCWDGSIGGPMTLYRDVAGIRTETVIPPAENPGKNGFYQKIRLFLDAVRDGGTAPIPTSQILYNQAIIDGIVRSAKIGKEIALEIPEL